MSTHYWEPRTGGALHAFRNPTAAVFTDTPGDVDCEVCLSNMAPPTSPTTGSAS